MAVAGYIIKRATNAAFTTGVVTTDVGNVLTIPVTGLAASTQYWWKIAAYDDADPQNTSGYSSAITATTTAGAAAIAFIAGDADASDTDASITPAINSTGGTLLVRASAYLGGAEPTVTDSKSNTWAALTERAGGTGRVRMYYDASPVVGTGHTFSANLITSYNSIVAAAFSGTLNAAPDGESGTGSGSATTLQPGSLTPSVDNCLIVTACQYVATSGTPSIDSGFTLIDFTVDVDSFGVAMAYKVQTTAAAVNPTWTAPGAADRMSAAMAVFKPL